MTMSTARFDLKEGEIRFSIADLLEAMTPKQRIDVARFVSADAVLFKAVLECVADDSAWGNYNKDDEDGHWWFDSTRVLELRQNLVPLMPTIARQAVTEALRQRNAAQAEVLRYREWAYKMFHAWPRRDDGWQSCPRGPDGYERPADPSSSEVDAMLAARTRRAEGEKKR
jgi:hypothetical protein